MVSAMGPPGGGRTFITERNLVAVNRNFAVIFGLLDAYCACAAVGQLVGDAVLPLRPEATLQHALG